MGDLSRARRAFAPLVARAELVGWTAGLASRVAALHYLSGDFEAALDALDRGRLRRPRRPWPDGPGPGRRGLMRTSSTGWPAGRMCWPCSAGRCRPGRPPPPALELAERLGNPQSLGVAHLAMARTGRGPVADLHYERALEHAAAAEDVVTATRALQARTSVLLALARYDEASVAAREAARLARLSCPPGLQAAALHNLGEALARTGEFGEALWHLECSVAVCRTAGSGARSPRPGGHRRHPSRRWVSTSRPARPTRRRPSCRAAPATSRCWSRPCAACALMAGRGAATCWRGRHLPARPTSRGSADRRRRPRDRGL